MYISTSETMMVKQSWNYVVTVKLPSDLKGVTPGQLPENLLKPALKGGRLHWLACAAWNAMVEKAKADGVELKPTSAGDTYRSYESQLAGFKQRYQLEKITGASTKSFEGKTWYLKTGMAMLATPGKSMHNLGLAIDIHTASEPKRLNWLIKNVKRFGFSWEVYPSEPWHIRYVNGDAPPAAVVAYMTANGISRPSIVSPAVKAEATPHLLKLGDSGPKVKRLQEVLKTRGLYKGAINGQFKQGLAEAVSAFKKANGLTPDGIAGPQVLKLLKIA